MQEDVQKLWHVQDIIFYLKIEFRGDLSEIYFASAKLVETVFVWNGFVQIKSVFDKIQICWIQSIGLTSIKEL